MATLTVYASDSDGYIRSNNATYATARTGGTLVVNTTGGLVVGQTIASDIYYCYETFTQFDTSAMPADSTITSVKLYLYLNTDNTGTDYTEEVRAFDWGETLTDADWISGADLGNYTLLSSKSVNPSAEYNEFSSSDNFKAAVNKTGYTRLINNSSRHRAGTTPTGDEYTKWESADTAGTTKDPKLVIEYTVPPPSGFFMFF